MELSNAAELAEFRDQARTSVAYARTRTRTRTQFGRGTGFAWEHDAHLYLKRATVLANVFGPLREAHRPIMAPDRREFA